MSLEKQIVDIIKKLNEEMRLADKRAKQLYLAGGGNGGGVPIGAIVPYLGGYFTDGDNGGFTMVMAAANTVAALNTLLNPDGFYVCDGAVLNHASSPIWNVAGRYLPKLTDDRFIQGDTVAGGSGGSNTMAHTHPVGTYAVAGESAHTHGISFASGAGSTHSHAKGTLATGNESAHTHAKGTLAVGNESAHTHSVTSNVTVSAHGITQPAFTGPSHRHTGPVHLHYIDPPNRTSTQPTGMEVYSRAGVEELVWGAHTHDVNIPGFNSSNCGTTYTDYAGTGACTRTTSVALSNNHSVGNNAVTSGVGSAHNHGLSGSTAIGSAHNHSVSGSTADESSHTHAVSGISGAGSTHSHGLSGSSGAASNTENRPKFLSCFYIVRAF